MEAYEVKPKVRKCFDFVNPNIYIYDSEIEDESPAVYEMNRIPCNGNIWEFCGIIIIVNKQ